MVGVFAHSGGSFKPAASIPVNNGGTWQNAQEVWAKENGVWVKVFPAEVREPATGEAFSSAPPYTWWSTGNANGSIVWYGATIIWNSPLVKNTVTSITIGGWTYYKGARKGQFLDPSLTEFGIYRIGTP